MEKNSLKDLLIPLHLISLAEGSFSGKTRLQKLVFLGQEEYDGDYDFKFSSAPLGPLSHKLLNAVDEAIDFGFIKRQKETTHFGFPVFRYSVTNDGKNILEFGIDKSLLSSKTIKANEKVMAEYGGMPYVQLLDYVHERYPEYRL